jgi:FtsH-binding integral membrane protein
MYNTVAQTQTYDVGLRNYFLSVYNNMILGLLMSGGIAYWMSTDAALMAAIWKTNLAWVVLFAPLVMSFGLIFIFDSMSSMTARLFFYLFAAVMGASLSIFFMMFKIGSIFQVFFITSATFAVMSVYGYTTNKDLSSLGSFLLMGVIGLVIAGIINIFLQSPVMTFVISCIAVLVFTVLVAVDTQQLKEVYYSKFGDEREKLGILGALNLYMDFINIFINLLQLLGEKNSD